MVDNLDLARLLKKRQADTQAGNPQPSTTTDKQTSTSTSVPQSTGTMGAGPGVGLSPTIVTLDIGQDPVFLIDSENPETIRWTADGDVRVSSVAWLYYEGTEKPSNGQRRSEISGKDGSFHNITYATLNGDVFESRDHYFTVNAARNEIIINSMDWMETENYHSESVQSILFKWAKGENGDDSGSSYLPFFTFIPQGNTNPTSEAELKELIEIVATKYTCSNGCDRDSSGGELLASTGGDDDTAQPTPSSGLPESDSSNGGKSGGGLGAGAIAGIVVGAVAGLAIIGALVFLFLRRRKSKQRAGFSDTQQTSDAFISDKTEQAQNADSPRSPYSDDGNQPGHLGSPGPTTAAGAVASTHHGSIAEDSPRPKFSSYQDTRSIDGRSNGAQTPQGMSRNVAHLVEEGMTEDDIRRLEEEERALDDAIERAGRR